MSGAVLAFRAGGRRFGVAASAVREVVRVPRLTPVPHAPASLLGIGNVRGEATAIVSAARLLGLAEGDPRQLILLGGEHARALAIDRVEGFDSGEACELPAFGELLDAAFPARADRSAARAAAQRTAAVVSERRALLRFAIGDQSFALPLDAIAGVLRVPDSVARLPRADAATLGSFAWRDALVPLFSLAALLDLPGTGGRAARIVVARIGGQPVGLLVDRIEALVHAPADRIDAVPPALLRSEAEAVIQAIHRPADGGRLVSILGTGQLLREELTRTLASIPAATVGTAAQAQAASEALLLFASGGQRFAIPLDAVREIARAPAAPGRIPHAPAFVRGVAAHRGEALVVVDLSAHLGAGFTGGDKARMVIVPIAGAEAGLLVERIDGIARIAADRIAPAPPLGDAATAPFARVVRLDHGDEAMLVLAADELFGRIADLIAGLAGGSAAAS